MPGLCLVYHQLSFCSPISVVSLVYATCVSQCQGQECRRTLGLIHQGGNVIGVQTSSGSSVIDEYSIQD